MKFSELGDEEPTLYWGVECRTCQEQIALGIRLHPRYGRISAFLKPGTLRCAHGHRHNYYSGDLTFFQPTSPVTDAQIEDNRSRFLWIDQPEQAQVAIASKDAS